MVDTDIHAALTEIFHDVFLRDDIVLTPELTARDVDGWDSFKQIELLIIIEERWKIKFSTREIDGLACVGDLLRLISKKAG